MGDIKVEDVRVGEDFMGEKEVHRGGVSIKGF